MFDDLKFEHPRVYFALLWSLIFGATFIVFLLLPRTPFLTSIGINGAQKRVSALGSAAYWKSRSLAHHKGEETQPIRSVWGNLAGLDKDGRLLVSVPAGSTWKIEQIRVADARVTDLYGAAGLINQFRTEDARFDYYDGEQVIVWIRGVPFNVKLIEAGFAVPDPNPPTNIVDIAFASYYWYIFKGEKNDETATESH